MATQADLDALEAALARGESEVRFSDGRLVRYRSPEELARAIAILTPRAMAAPMMRATPISFERD